MRWDTNAIMTCVVVLIRANGNTSYYASTLRLCYQPFAVHLEYSTFHCGSIDLYELQLLLTETGINAQSRPLKPNHKCNQYHSSEISCQLSVKLKQLNCVELSNGHTN